MDLSVSPLARSNGIKVTAHSVHLFLIKGLHRYSKLSLFVELDMLSRKLTLVLSVCYFQRDDCDAALVAAFRREQEKEAQLKATIAAKQIAEHLVRSSS